MEKKIEKIKKKRIVLNQMDKKFIENLIGADVNAQMMLDLAMARYRRAKENLREFIERNWPEYKKYYWSFSKEKGEILFREKVKFE